MPQCVGCGTEIEASKGSRPRKWCKDACRKKNGARVNAKTTAPAAVARGDISHGLAAWLESRNALPEALVSAAIALAAQLDVRPDDASLWRQYLATFQNLSDVSADAEREAAQSLADFRTECMTIDAAERERARRYREAMDAGDEIEARRWDSMVPAGCLRGEHRLQTFPDTGVTRCLDCQGWTVPPDDGLPHRIIEVAAR
jgi:hypothetical protein